MKVLFLILLASIASAQIEPSDVRYYLYNKEHQEFPQQMMTGSLLGASYDPTKASKFLIHSLHENFEMKWVKNLKDAYVTHSDHNIISVDWAQAAEGGYNEVANRVPEVGFHMADFILYLQTQGGQQNLTHCIGSGFGAHVCGFAGKNIQTEKIARISGLDPNRDRFDIDDPTARLSTNDAEFVDVIHTCSKVNYQRPIGHADFFPNNGGDTCDQPGCGFGFDNECSHERSRLFYTESVSSDQFRSIQCETWQGFNQGNCDLNEAVPMGDPCPSTASRNYYLHTRGDSPFAMG